MEKNKHHSDSLFLGIILFFIGGFQNVYTYMNCGKVFANLQTGNMMLMAVDIANGELDLAFRYLIPLLGFWLGCMVGTIVDIKCKYNFKMHWRIIILIIEALCAIVAAFLPYKIISAAIITFNCALSLQGFKMIKNRSLPTTMMIGNMRKAVEHFTKYFIKHDKSDLREGLLVLLLIVVFALGGIVGAKLSIAFKNHTILFLIPLYLICIIYLQFDTKC